MELLVEYLPDYPNKSRLMTLSGKSCIGKTNLFASSVLEHEIGALFIQLSNILFSRRTP
jgi:hypothetical protein